MSSPTSPWDAIVEELAVLSDTELRHRLKVELGKAFRQGWRQGRQIGFDEAYEQYAPTRHDMGG
jgi:hypothetical protein